MRTKSSASRIVWRLRGAQVAGRLLAAAPVGLHLVGDLLALVQAAQAGGRGVIVISGHFTTLELSARLMCDYAPLAGMYRPHATGAMEWAVKRGRLRYATAMFTRDELRPALKHLKQGGLLWFARKRGVE